MRAFCYSSLIWIAAMGTAPVFSQSINSGTIAGVISDPTGAVIPGADVSIKNALTRYEQHATTDSTGAFRFTNVPLNPYRLTVSSSGFTIANQVLDVRSSVPITANVVLALGGTSTTVTVEAEGAQVETDTSAHQAVDRNEFLKLPTFDPGGALNQAITYSTGAVAADANGFFHPLGDHAQVGYVIDGQPITDQQSKVFSTQIPLNALQSMELITGSQDAQYGDKTSLVVNATTRSGLGATKAFGDIESQWGSFGTWGGNVSFGIGTPKFGNFISLNGVRTGHFLDTPEFLPIHDRGNNSSIFDRFDWQPAPKDAFHLNLFTTRNWFQVPNSLDQLSQDQTQRVLTWSIAPGYQHTFSAQTLLTANAYVRHDQLNYYPSADLFADTPVTASQLRFLTNYGIKADIAHTRGIQEIRVGLQIQQTRLNENFQFGVTDPTYNPVCLDSEGQALLLPNVTDPSACTGVNPTYSANPNLLPGIIPYDLTRGGSLFSFHGSHNVNQYAFYFTDTIRWKRITINAGLREDQYNGLTSANSLQPRIGLSYKLFSNTVLRGAYSRTFETPFNENLVLSSGTGGGGLAQNVFGSVSQPIKPGNRNQFNLGLQQGIGRWIIVDADYFWKYTNNAYDFSVFFNTPITFPIAWNNSKLDGVTGRISTVSLHGFQAFMTLGHTRARYFPPEVGGLIPLGGFSDSVFRIDHDQAYQQTVVMRYQRPKNEEWIDFTWRYDSGQVVSGVPDVDAALALTATQQVAIGFSCNGQFATLSQPITSCSGPGRSTLLTLPQTGTENDDHNPDRVKPRNLFNVGVGTDNLFHSESGGRWVVRFTVENLTNKVALYNFLSTFSGTHFVAPRTFQASVGYMF
ncbi:MAG TPA: TonB-dependent receptor [Bryobacteraceae bacterium]|nr:TonB-dependent receptor [Bryobacteraceae bacterium]